MKLVRRNRSRARKAPRIEVSEAEILRDLTYPASSRPTTAERRSRGRR